MLRLAALAAVLLVLFVGLSFHPAQAGPVNRTLDRSLPEMKFTGVTFGEAIDFLRDVSGLNIHVNWKALEPQNVTADTPVNIRVRAVSMRKVLNLLLSEASGGDTLAWYVDGGVIEVTTKEMADRKVYTKVYPVDDLIMEVPDFTNAPTFSLQSTSQQGQGSGGGGGGGGGGSGTGLFENSDQDRNSKEPTKTKAERGEELVQLVKDLVQPEIWVDNGGTATIRYYNGSLIVTAPRSVHEAIGGSWD
jgi:uncharacterized membrane protein YgcG